MTSNGNILDSPVPDINTPLLLPKKYIKPKEKKSMTDKVKEEVINLFDQFKRKPGRPKKIERRMVWRIEKYCFGFI